MRCSSAACSCRNSRSLRSWRPPWRAFRCCGPPPSPAPMTLVPGSGLLKRIKAPEWYFSLRPEVGGVAEDIQQLLARLAIEARVVRKLLQHDDEARLLACLVHEVGHAVVQRIEVLAEVHREQEGLGDAVEHFLLGLGRRQVRIEEVLAGVLGRLLQVLHAIGADRLNDVRTDSLQKHVAFLLSQHKALLFTFGQSTMRRKLA